LKIHKIFLAMGLVGLTSAAYAEQVQNVVAVPLDTDSVSISWDPLEDTAYYDVYENSTDRIASGVTDLSFLRSGLSAGTSYQYFVTACDTDGVCGEASIQTTVTTLEGEMVIEEEMAAEDLVASYVDNGDGTVSLSWTEVDAADGYNIFINNDYYDTVFATLTTSFPFIAGDVYQVAWFGGGMFPAKSAPATLVMGTEPEPEPEMEMADTLSVIDAATAGSDTDVEIYFTRHAEKKTELTELDNGDLQEVCGDSKCAEVLNSAGELRAALLEDAFADAGITSRLTHAFSSHKTRTRQTIEAIVAAAGLSGDVDKNAGDGIQENPVMNDDGTANATELDPQSTSGSVQPTIDALVGLSAGSVALVAGHSGTLYDIMAGLGLTDVCLTDTVDTCNQDRYPIDDSVKVRDYGDIWKIVLQDGVASFAYRVNLQPKALELNNVAK
jgi:broad specificity phosphatase PhoE